MYKGAMLSVFDVGSLELTIMVRVLACGPPYVEASKFQDQILLPLQRHGSLSDFLLIFGRQSVTSINGLTSPRELIRKEGPPPLCGIFPKHAIGAPLGRYTGRMGEGGFRSFCPDGQGAMCHPTPLSLRFLVHCYRPLAPPEDDHLYVVQDTIRYEPHDAFLRKLHDRAHALTTISG